MQRLASQMPAAFHCLEQMPFGYVSAVQPRQQTINGSNSASIQDRHFLSPTLLVGLGAAYRNDHAIRAASVGVYELHVAN